MQTFLEIPVGRQKLAACLHRPSPGSTQVASPVVVCCHGLTGTRVGTGYRMVRVARRLVKQNIACLRFDFRGCGESEGRFEDLTVSTLVEDLHAAIHMIDHLPGCDPTRIGLIGSSMGAYTAALVAPELFTLRCAAFWSPVADVRNLADRIMTDETRHLLEEQGYLDHNGQRLSRPFFDKIPDTDAPAALAKTPHPLLIFHGTADQSVPIEHGRAYEAATKNAGGEVRFEEVPGGDHSLRSVEVGDLIVLNTVAWMRRFLHPEPLPESTS